MSESDLARGGLSAVDVLSRLPKDWAEKALKGGKWSERKEYVDKLIELIGHPTPPLVQGILFIRYVLTKAALSTPRCPVLTWVILLPGDYSEVVRCLRLLMSDSMVLLVTVASPL
eukprot:3629147-Rhodomonas_salina.4